MTIQEKFIAWMKEQGAWDEYVKSCESDDSIAIDLINSCEPENFIASAFPWFESESGFQYWRSVNNRWITYLENNE